MRTLTALAVAVVLLLTAASAAGAREFTTAEGRPAGARNLHTAVTLPNGQESTLTFALRKAGGARIKGYAVERTKYFYRLNFSEYFRVSRGAAYQAFHASYIWKARFAYSRLTGDGKTYNVLARVYYQVVGE